MFPEVKGGRCVRLTTLPPPCAVVVKSGNLNFLEPSGPLQACKGTAHCRLILVCEISIPSNTTDARIRSRTNPCEICGGQSGSGTVLSPSNSVFPRQHICTNAPYSYSLGNLPESNFLSDDGEHWRESTFT